MQALRFLKSAHFLYIFGINILFCHDLTHTFSAYYFIYIDEEYTYAHIVARNSYILHRRSMALLTRNCRSSLSAYLIARGSEGRGREDLNGYQIGTSAGTTIEGHSLLGVDSV
jgi:hypothetical protein